MIANKLKSGLEDIGDLGDFNLDSIGDITTGVGEALKEFPGGEHIGQAVEDSTKKISDEANKAIEGVTEGIGNLLKKKEEPSE